MIPIDEFLPSPKPNNGDGEENEKLELFSTKEIIQRRVSDLIQYGVTVVDTSIHTVEAVRMAYLRELRKVDDVLGIPKQTIKETRLPNGLVRLELVPAGKIGTEFRILPAGKLGKR